MALGFFRRNQKMVIGIMVVLMISFLVGGSQLQSCARSRAEKGVVLGTTSLEDFEEVTSANLARAEREIQLVTAIGPATGLIVPMQFFHKPVRDPRTGRTMMGAISEDAPLTWDLMVKEAYAAGLEATDFEVQQILLRYQQVAKQNELETALLVMAENSRMDPPPGEDEIRQTLADYLVVEKNLMRNMLHMPVAEATEKRLFRDLREQIKLAFVVVPASKYLDEVPEPTADQVQEFFEKHKDQAPGVFSGPDDFGFGYRQPDRVNIHALVIGDDAIELAVAPTVEAIEKYIADRPEEFLKMADLPEDAAPDAEPEMVQMTMAEKKQKAAETLKLQLAATARMDLQNYLINTVLADLDGQPDEAYPKALAKLKLAKPAVLDRKIAVKIVRKPLKEALALLSDAANTQVVFPTGTHGEVTIDENVLVDLPAADGGTLGQALLQLGGKFEVGPFQYVKCQTLPGAIFPISDQINMFPVKLVQTGLIDADEFRKTEILSSSYILAGQQGMLGQLAFNAPELRGEQDPQSSRVSVGKDGPVARSFDPPSSVIWRLVDAQPAQSPEELSDQLKQQVADDWRIQQAYQLALSELTKTVKNPKAMRNLAKTLDLEVGQTDMLARKGMGQAGPIFRAPLSETLRIPITAQAQLEAFYKRVFALAPGNINGSFDRVGEGVAIAGVPAFQGGPAVILAQRIDYEPALESEFRPGDTGLSSTTQRKALLEWFNSENVETRTGYQRK